MDRLRLAEAQQLADAIEDPLLAPALKAFLHEERVTNLDLLLAAIRKSDRDVMKEARLAGLIEAYETFWSQLVRFSAEQNKPQ